MLKQIIPLKWVFLLVILFITGQTWAHGNHYAAAIAKVGDNSHGKVYASNGNTRPADDSPNWSSTQSQSTTSNCGGSKNGDSMKFYVFAKPDDGYSVRWDDNKTEDHEVTISGGSGSSNSNPTTKTFTANFSAINYNITYNLDGGTNAVGNPSTYTVEDEITLAPAAKDGFAFVKWSDGGVIARGSTGDKTFTANFIDLSATKAQGKDVTGIIVNNSFEAEPAGTGWIYTTGAANSGWHSHNLRGGKSGNYCAEAYHEAFTIEQTLTNMPNGTYELTGQGFYRQDDNITETVPYFYINEQKSDISVLSGTENGMDDASDSFGAGKYTTTPIRVVISNGTLRIGVKSENATSQWCIFDNFQLKYYGNPASNQVEAELNYGEENATTVGNWYSINIPATAEYSVPQGCYYTNDPYLTVEEVTTTFASNKQTLEQGTYYIKANSTSIFVGVDNYDYTVSIPVANVANNSYVQNGVVTFTFGDETTSTDPSATFALLSNSININDAPVADILSLNGKVLTFTIPDFAPGQTYNITIPAGAVGYAGQATNGEISLTVNTPALYDGYYYFKNNEGKYMSRGGSWGTQLIWDEYGIAMKVATDVEGNSTLKCFDNNLYTDGDYSDKSPATNFTLTRSGDVVTFNNIECTVETIEEHKANYTANADAQVAVLNIDGVSTLAQLEEYVADQKTVEVEISGSKAEKYQEYSSNANPTVPNTYYSETIEGLTPGLYRLTVDAFQRAASNEWVSSAEGARGLIYLYANDAKTQLKSVMDYGANSTYSSDYTWNGKHYPNDQNSAYVALATGNYKNTVYVMVGEDGRLEMGIKNPVRQSNSSDENIYKTGTWCAYNNWRLDYITDAAGILTEAYIKKARAVNAVWNNTALEEAISSRDNDAIIAALPQAQLTETFDEEISTWTGVKVGENAYYAIGSYGSATAMNGVTPPATDMYGTSEGKLAGISAGWDNSAKYTKNVNLPAGVYALYYEAYNANAATTVKANLAGVCNANTSKVETLGTTRTKFVYEGWTADAIKVYVREDGEYTITIGMQGDGGSGNNAKLWIDNVTFFRLADKVVETSVFADDAEYYFKAQNGQYATTSATYPLLSGSGNQFIVKNNALGETLFELKGTGKYMFFNDEPGNAEENYAVYTDGTNPPAKATHGLYWVINSVGGGKYTVFNSMYQKYLGVSGNYLTKSDEAYEWTLETAEQQELHPDMDMTGHITNPSFEFDQKVIATPTGWTVNASSDTGVKSTTNATYEAKGSDGKYLFNTWNDGKALTQTISELPAAGVYQLSAMLATGDSESDAGTVYLTVDGVQSAGMTARHGNKKYMKRETLTFVIDEAKAVEIGAIGANTGNGDTHWWYKADDFKLRYLDETSELYKIFQSVYEASAPWTTDGDYYTAYSGYASYKAETSQEELLAAINYMNSKYDDYCWDNASEEHPYDMTELVIKGAELSNNDDWPGDGRTLASGQHWSGDAGRNYFSFQSGTSRHQATYIPYLGKYELRTAVRTLGSGAFAQVVIASSGDADVKTRTDQVTGSTGGNINIDGTEGTDNLANGGNGYGWVYNKIEYIADKDNKDITIWIDLSDKDKVAEANAGGMYLYYTGNTFDYTKNGVHYFYGGWNEQAAELTDAVPVLDVTNATGSFNVTATNANGLVYTNGATVNGVTNNIVSNGTCDNLVLADGGTFTFKAHKQFEASSATYEMTAIASNGEVSFGTLMLPFAVSALPGKAYTLDQGVTFGEEIHATEVNAITANTPVLVTAKGTYSASAVSVPVTTEDTYTNGELVGTYKSMSAVQGSYVLQKHDNRVAFYLVDGTQPTVKPFRAYIKAQAADARLMRVIFDDEETGVESLTTDDGQQTTMIYDLSGRRVQKAQKGIYIINGKKTMK